MERIDWWRGIAWREWLDEPSVVDRPVEDAVMTLLALQTYRAQARLMQVATEYFIDVVKEAMREDRHDMTLREVHHARGVELQWRETVTRRGNKYIEVVEVQLPRAS